MSAAKIVVIGLGATGSAALAQLARRGIAAIGIEQFAVGHDRGSSHGATRIFRLAHFENAGYVPLLQRAYQLWRELESVSERPLLTLTGIVEVGPRQGPLVTGTLAAAQRYQLRHQILDATALMQRYPQFRLPQGFAAVVQPDAGIIEAGRAIDANIGIARDAGACIRINETVLAIAARSSGVRIRTDRGEIDADGAIVATGPWTKSLMPELNLPLRVTRQVVGWFGADDAAAFSIDRFPIFLLESRHGIHYGFPDDRTTGVKVAKHHHMAEAIEPDKCDRKISAADEALIRGPLADFLPGANGRLLDAQTCLYTMTPDDTFIVDHMPGFPHIVIASPCCGHGFKFSPVIGEIVVDLVTRGSTDADISQFRLKRFG
jgi:sarcosine oxidase